MKIGIDLGTTYSCAAYIKNGKPEVVVNYEGSKTTPSVVLFENDNEIVVGKDAKEQIIICPEKIVSTVKNYMGTDKVFELGGRKYSPEEISALILKKLIRDSENYTGEKVEGIVVTIPAYFTDAQRKATYDACSLLSVPLLAMINEPTAAALCYKNNSDIVFPQLIMVYDLGGGTFDVSIVKFEKDISKVIATGGLRKLGGHYFDQLIVNRIVEYIKELHGIDLYEDEYVDILQDLSIKAEKCKIQLSTMKKADIFVRIGDIREKISITREEFNALIDRFYRRTESIIVETLKDAGISFADLNKIILVGGSSRIPYIYEQLKLLSGIEPSMDINPDEAVGVGAAIYANDVEQQNIIDVCSHSLGIALVNNVNSIIIPRNTSLPIRREKTYVIPSDGISSIIMNLTEGEGDDIEFVNQFASFEIDIPSNTPKGTSVCVRFELDKNQILSITTRVMLDPLVEKQVKIDRKGNLSVEEIEKKRSALSLKTIQNDNVQDKQDAGGLSIDVDIQNMNNIANKVSKQFNNETNKESEPIEDEYPDLIKESFNRLIGMKAVKQQLYNIYNRLVIEKARTEQGITTVNNNGYNFILYGNPGTGKTTVARIIAEVLYKCGLLEKNILIETDRSGLVGQYIGETEKKTREILSNSIGGTLFIDEAYALFEEESEKDFGKIAIDTLLKDLEDNRGKYCVILAGYKDRMKNMIKNANPGFSSRFDYHIEIPDYTDDELYLILENMASERGLSIVHDAKTKIFENIRRERIDETFDNARFMRRLLNKAIEKQASRLIKKNQVDKSELFILTVQDFETDQEIIKSTDDYLDEIDRMIGLDTVKKEIHQLVEVIRVNEEKKKRNIPIKNPIISYHMAFTGNPGTGKTTVARLLGKILSKLGILKRNDVFVECTRADFVGGYQGQTAIKTKKLISSALGGILFIDEAYNLVNGPEDNFGMEALNTLIAEMENKRDSFSVIIAGYSKEIEDFMDLNPGLKSRIPKTIEFPDYSIENMADIFMSDMEKRGYNLCEIKKEAIINLISSKCAVKNFGNARGVRNICDAVERSQNIRISKILQDGDVSDYNMMLLTEGDLLI